MIDTLVKLKRRQEQTGVSHRALSPDKEPWPGASIRCLLYPALWYQAEPRHSYRRLPADLPKFCHLVVSWWQKGTCLRKLNSFYGDEKEEPRVLAELLSVKSICHFTEALASMRADF